MARFAGPQLFIFWYSCTIPANSTLLGMAVGTEDGVKVSVIVGEGRSSGGVGVVVGCVVGVVVGVAWSRAEASVVVSCPCGTKTTFSGGLIAYWMLAINSSPRQARR